MKLITAVIRPSRLKKVSNALEAAGLTGLTATEVQGRGAQGGRTEYYRGEAHDVVFRTKVRLEMVVADEHVGFAIGQPIIDLHRRARHDEQFAAIDLDLGHLVRRQRGDATEAPPPVYIGDQTRGDGTVRTLAELAQRRPAAVQACKAAFAKQVNAETVRRSVARFAEHSGMLVPEVDIAPATTGLKAPSRLSA